MLARLLSQIALTAVLLASCCPAHAQNVYLMVGGSFDASTTPHSAIRVGAMLPLNDGSKTFSYTVVDIRGVSRTAFNPITTTQTGIAYQTFCQGRLCLYGNAKAGGVVGTSAASGAISGGLIPTFDLTKDGRLKIAGQIEGFFAPATGGAKPAAAISLVFAP